MKKLLITLFVFAFLTAKAQYQKPFFNTLSIRSGLPEAWVVSTLEDKNGYIWMGTQNGLVRYDGYQLKPYPITDDDGLPVAAPSIRYLQQDKDGKIWAFLFTGAFYYYDRALDKFVKTTAELGNNKATNGYQILNWIEDKQENICWLFVYNFNNGKVKIQLYKFNTKNLSLKEYSATQKGNQQIAIKDLRGVTKDASGKIWITGDNLLCFYDVASNSFKKYFELPESLKGNHLSDPVPDPLVPDVLWIITDSINNLANINPAFYGKHLLRFNINTKGYQLFNVNEKDPNALRANLVGYQKDSLNRLWFFTNKGVSLFDAKRNSFKNYPINFVNNNGGPSTIAADKSGNCWIGGNFQGLYYLNTTTGISTLYKSDQEEGSLPFYRNISDLFFDRSGTLWVNMPYFGIAYLDRQKSLFAAQPIVPNNIPAKANSNPSVFKIVGASGDSICYIADTSSLYAWHTQQNKFDKIELKKDVYKNIEIVVNGGDGNIWVGIQGYGLFQYNSKTKLAINYTNNPKDSNSISSNNVRTLTTDANGTVWIGTGDKGLCSFNISAKKFTRYPYSTSVKDTTYIGKELADNRVFSLLIDHSGLLWIGTNNGFASSYDVKTKEFTNYIDRKKGLFCVPEIFEDSKQRLWIGSYLSGLFLFNRITKTFKNYTEQDGLLHKTVFQIQEDASGDIWCLSPRGLSRLDPSTNKITGFRQVDPSARGDFSTIYKDAANTFRLNGEDGIIHFNPADLKANPVAPSVVIESLQYHSPNDTAGRDIFLYPRAGEKITLHYNENKIGFQYVALQFDNPANNQYAFQLVGYDKDWIPAGTQRTATYTNLSPGTYTFKIKAANSDGVWNNTGASITIVILPPWWKTWWAYLIYAILFVVALSAFIAYRSAALKRENKVLEDKVTLRTSQLQSSIADLKSTQSQLIQSEKMASLGELTAGIAHEIQNPLNFVNNFSEVNKEMLEELKAERLKPNAERDDALQDELINDVIDNSEKINHHGKRADAIVKGMLQHSRQSSGKKEPTDINALADEYLRLSYHGLRAKDKTFNAEMKTDFDGTIGKINVIPQDIGRVLLNLFNNAFYAVNARLNESFGQEQKTRNPELYKPTVSVKTMKCDDKVQIIVKDNGNGIPQKIVDKIFQPFFTTKPTGEGTGLGLSLAYDIVKAHGGEIKVESTFKAEGSEPNGTGTTFIITLPGEA
jgi:signal transduction histidine kinase/ligand-binding sensor domain-containing protein